MSDRRLAADSQQVLEQADIADRTLAVAVLGAVGSPRHNAGACCHYLSTGEANSRSVSLFNLN